MNMKNIVGRKYIVHADPSEVSNILTKA